jgi:hypothetical protein
MSLIDTVYLIAAAASVDALAAAMTALADAGYATTSSADHPTPAGVFSALASAGTVVAVEGWELSPGARVEIGISAALGKPVLSLSDLLPLAA